MVYIYSTRSPLIEELLQKGLIHKAVKDLPSTYEALENVVAPFYNDGVIVIVDDGLSQMQKSQKYLPRVFEEFKSKKNTPIIFVSQSIFFDSSNFRRMSYNSHYIICLRDKRNPAKIRSLALQAKPCNPKFILNAYIDATKKNLFQLLTPITTGMDISYLILVCNHQKFLHLELIFSLMS